MPDLRKEILYPGYLISLSDDTLAGMVMFKSLTRNQTEVVFYDSVAIGHNPRIAKPGEINGYVISGMNYRSVPFSGRYSSRKMTFMYCLADGPVSVYKWFFHEKQQYFEDNAFWDYKTTYAVDDIQHQFFVCRKNSKPLVISDCEIEFRFEKKMIRYLSDNKMIASKIKEKQPGYRCNDLVRIINEYNSR
jgi:hypothetical protein